MYPTCVSSKLCEFIKKKFFFFLSFFKVEQMKELYEEQQRLKLEAELEAYRIKKEQEDKEKKKAKLSEMKPK